MKTVVLPLVMLGSLFALPFPSAEADTFGNGGNTFTLPFVPIGNAGNAADTTGYGAVSYNYNMSVTDVSQTMLTDLATLSGLN